MTENHRISQSDTSALEETIEKLVQRQKEILKAFRPQKGKKAKARTKALGNKSELNNELREINNELKKHEAPLRIAKGEPKHTRSQLQEKQQKEEFHLSNTKKSATKPSAKKDGKSAASRRRSAENGCISGREERHNNIGSSPMIEFPRSSNAGSSVSGKASNLLRSRRWSS